LNSLYHKESPEPCSPTFFLPGHTFLEPFTRRHTAFMVLILYVQDLWSYDV